MSDAKPTCPNCIIHQRQVAQLLKVQAQLLARVARLEERLAVDSSNSSKPPSSDSPFKSKPKKESKKKRRQRGGQKGHPGKARDMLPPEKVTQFVSVFPDSCSGCRRDLSQADVVDPDNPGRHQVLDLPEIRLDVTEYQLFKCRCPECGEHTAASLPSGVPLSAMGPRLQAHIALLCGQYHMSLRNVQEYLTDTVDANIALGTTSNANARTSEALATVYNEAVEAVRSADVINADETGWKERNQRAYLWVALAESKGLAAFRIDLKRSEEAWHRLIGKEYKGFLGTDRHGAYNNHEITLHQYCWAHLKRDFQKIIDRGGPSEKVGESLMDIKTAIFDQWHSFRENLITRDTLCENLIPIIESMQQALESGMLCSNKMTARFCKRLLTREFDGLWAFCWAENVEPTNNSAERAIRMAVLKRKRSFGTQSAGGSRFVERILTVVQSLRLQHRPVFNFLVEACAAAITGRLPPSLMAEG